MLCSTIIPTVGRPELSRAVESVLDQDFPTQDYEVIVVNDSGQPLIKAGWQQSERVQVIETFRRERSMARNTGAAIAQGRYLHFLDDDDWLAPNALEHFWQLSQTSRAVWLYGYSQLVNRQNNPTIRLQHGLNGNCFIQVMAGEWIPLQASLIDAETFFETGGFNPLISGPEDIDLLRRITLVGEIAETPHVVAFVVRGKKGSTTDYDEHSKASRWAREKILDAPGVFNRMRASAKTPYFQGRIIRIYSTSLVWNLRRKRLLTAASRGLYGLAGMALSGPRLFSQAFWQAVSKPYANETFKRGFQEARPLP